MNLKTINVRELELLIRYKNSSRKKISHITVNVMTGEVVLESEKDRGRFAPVKLHFYRETHAYSIFDNEGWLYLQNVHTLIQTSETYRSANVKIYGEKQKIEKLNMILLKECERCKKLGLYLHKARNKYFTKKSNINLSP